jgi:predicted nucleic acid-binding protein
MINLDANIVIDILDEDYNTSKLHDIISQNDICVTPITVHIVWYFFDKGKINTSKQKMIDFFEAVEILSMSKNIFKRALIISKSEDIEDGMQVACCLENNVDKIITSDGGLYSKYSKLISVELFN